MAKSTLEEMLGGPSKRLYPFEPKQEPTPLPEDWAEQQRRWVFAVGGTPIPSGEPEQERELAKLSRTVQQLGKRIDGLATRAQQMEATLNEIRRELRDRPITSQSTIYDLNNTKFTLRMPIPIVIEDYEQEVLARFPELELHGEGATEPEAIASLKREFVELYDDLSGSNQDELGKLPKQWLTTLLNLVEVNE